MPENSSSGTIPSMPPSRPQTAYRPPASRLTAEQVADKLRRNESAFRTRWIILIALGAIVTMLVPLVIAALKWSAQAMRRNPPPQSFMMIAFQVCAIALPIFFLLEWITRGKLMEKTAETVGDLGLSSGARLMPGVGRGVAVIAFIEFCLWGPRMVIAGSKRIFGMSRHRGADRALAGKMLHALIVKGEGLPTAKLYPLADGRDDAFSDALAYLLFFDLIGISKTGDRAWMLGDAKRTLKLETN
jgi:hypothetical protein